MPATSPYPQGTFTFSGGIPPDAVLSFRVTQNHGITPAVFKVRMVMLPQEPDKNGDVVIQYGPGGVGGFKLTFPDCTIDLIDRPNGAELVWDVTILDRRWKWRFGKIDGAYNQRWKNGTELRTETKKKPSELAKLCFEAMGETKYDLTALKAFDGLDFPETTWNNANPAEVLQQLCENYGCRLLCIEDRAVIVKVGDGEELDASGNTYTVMEDSRTFDPPERPGRIVLRGPPTSVQADLPLFAVAVDVDGKIKPINKVSYAPGSPTFLQGQPIDYKSGTYADDIAGFWNTAGGGLYGLPSPYLRHLAEENIYRLYLIYPPKNFPSLNRARGDSAKDTSLPSLEDFPEFPTSANIWRIALQNEQNDRLDEFADPLLGTKFDEYNKEVSSSPLPAWVYGQYYNGSMSSGNVLIDDLDAQGNITKRGILKLDPSIKTGVVSQQQANLSFLPGQLPSTEVATKVVGSGFYMGGFSIIPEFGLVKFSEPVYQVLAPNKSGVTATFSDGTPMDKCVVNFPPALWLRTRFLLRDPVTRGWVRPERIRVLDKNNPTTRYVTRDDLLLKMTYRYKGPPNITSYPPTFAPTAGESNWDVISKAMDAYIDEIEKEYQTVQPHSVVFGGFVPYEIDGAIREVTWYIGEDGHSYTRACRNTDYLVWHQDYAERRLAERQKAKVNERPDPTPPRAQRPVVF